MLVDFEIRTDCGGSPALLAVVVDITNTYPETLDYEYKSIYDMANDVVVFEHELLLEELEAIDTEIIKWLVAQDKLTGRSDASMALFK